LSESLILPNSLITAWMLYEDSHIPSLGPMLTEEDAPGSRTAQTVAE
jgi:hypothetical protein